MNLVQTKCTFCGGTSHSKEKYFKKIRNDKEKSGTTGDLHRQLTERLPRKCFRWGSVDHLIDKFLKPRKDNKKLQKTVRFIERGNRASQKVYEEGDDDHYQNIYLLFYY